MLTTVIDAAIVLCLAFFAWRGGRKGLILTLFSLLAVFVAWFGAKAVTDNFTAPVANILRPSIALTIDEVLSPAGAEKDGEDEGPRVPVVGIPGVSVPEDSSPGSEFTVPQIVDLLGEAGKFTGLQGFLEDAAREDAMEVTTTPAAAVAAYLSQLIAGSLLFAVSFLLILLVWFLVSRALDLAFKLPGLSALNAVGGAVFGLVKGLAVVLVLVWLAGLAGVLTAENAGPVASRMTAERLTQALNGLIQGAAGISSAE